MSDFQAFESKLDARFDRLESKIDKYAEKTTTHAEQIKSLQGYLKHGLALFLAAVGALTAAFFTKGNHP